MGTDEDRARVRGRLAAASTGGEPGWLTDDDRPDRYDDAVLPGPDRWRGLRLNPGRRGIAALVVVGLVAAIVAAVTVWRDRPAVQAIPPLPVVESGTLPDTEPASPSPPSSAGPPVPAPAEELVVSVVGVVERSGLVRLPPGSRVADALAAAGGARPGADVLGLNMAERVDDGDQILVGAAAPDGGPTTVGSARIGSGAGAAGTAAKAGAQPGGKVNLNTADEAALDALPGVGPVTATAIVAWRATNGRFTDVEQLGEVDGIGPGRLAKLRDLVTV
ncbi:ComEA family DNA-binding protein [Prescottella sp. R16]|uniref:ComEA family DNA-binding protein n=1 Tax=Prescottella sp. R16 TaxID=3064529 RepID=UPI00272EB1BB|nr:ComEA family DNA-binding protein [Prescottella sp. R16]